MPLYEYACKTCRKRTTVLVRSFAGGPEHPPCEHCGSTDTRRLVSKFAVRKSWGESLDALPDSAFNDVDEDNAGETADWMRRVKGDMGGAVSPEYDHMMSDLEGEAAADEE